MRFRFVRWIVFAPISALIVGFCAFFVLNNRSWVVVRLPQIEWRWPDLLAVAEFESPLALMMGVAFTAGGLIFLALRAPAALRGLCERRRQKRRIAALEAEVAELRADQNATVAASYQSE